MGGGESQETVRTAPGAKKKRKEVKKEKPSSHKTMMSEHMNQSEKTERSKKTAEIKKSAAYPAGSAADLFPRGSHTLLLPGL